MDNQVEKQTVETTENNVSATKTMKRGTVVQAVKAIAVLVCICLVCGALLALCNDIFFISDAERNRRAEAKFNASLVEVYPALSKPQTVALNKEYATNSNYGSVERVVKSDDGAYVLSVEGIGGFGGSIIVVIAIDSHAKIVGWKVSDGGGETYLADVTQHTDWYLDKEISTDIEFMRHSGATYTSTALNNAMKMASYYAMNALNLGENPEKDARDAIATLLASDDKYADYVDYAWDVSLDADYRTASNVTYKVDDDDVTATLSYYFVGTKDDSQDLAAYVFVVNDELQVVITNENVTHANRKVVAVSSDEEGNSIVNQAVVDSVVNRSYFEYTIQKMYADFTYAGVEEVSFDNGAKVGGVNKIYASGDGVRIFEATGYGDYGTGGGDGVVTINVAVSEQGKLLAWSLVSTTTPTGSAYVISKVLADENSSSWYKDATITSSIDVGSNKTSGATMSSTAINNAIKSIGAYLEQGGSN